MATAGADVCIGVAACTIGAADLPTAMAAITSADTTLPPGPDPFMFSSAEGDRLDSLSSLRASGDATTLCPDGVDEGEGGAGEGEEGVAAACTTATGVTCTTGAGVATAGAASTTGAGVDESEYT